MITHNLNLAPDSYRKFSGPKLLFAVVAAFFLFVSIPATADPSGEFVGSGRIGAQEYSARRQATMARLDDGILLLHARSWFSGYDQVYVHAFQQNPGF